MVPHCGVQGGAQATCRRGTADWPTLSGQVLRLGLLEVGFGKNNKTITLGVMCFKPRRLCFCEKIKDNHKTCGSMHFILEIQGNLILTKKRIFCYMSTSYRLTVIR